MKSLTATGKLALAAILVAAIGMSSSWAGDRGESSWWLRKKNKQSTSTDVAPASIGNFNSGSAGKAVTKTEVFAGRSVLPMVSQSSAQGMADAVARYELVVSRGGWPQVPNSRTLAKASSGRDVVVLRRRLAAEGYLPEENLTGKAAEEYSENLMKAVAQFQSRYGLALTGKIDKATAQAMNVPAAQRLATLRANLPRMQEYAKDLGPRYIIVNVPALQLEAVNFNTVFSRHNIIAGQPSRPTPVTMTQISDINFNPYWNAPASIVDKDILPRIRREGTRVLRDMNMRVHDGYNGPEVNPDDIDWDNVPADRFFFRQDPGEENAMAGVKINFPSPFGIYLHDTPTKYLFTTGARYLSSGCIRVEQVQILVNWILNGQDGWGMGRIEQVTASRERVDVKVTEGPQLRTVYLTAWANANGQVHFRNDIYDLDGTGFAVGQPLAPDEYSEDGQRFVLKPINRPASASYDEDDYLKSRKPRGFGVFSASRERSSGSNRLLGRRDEMEDFNANFSNTRPEPKKKTATSIGAKKKQQADAKKKKKLLQPTASAKKKPEKAKIATTAVKSKTEKSTAAVATAKPKSEKTAATANKKKQEETAAATVQKKKKKIEEASASAAVPEPQTKPIFTQQ